MKFKPGDKVKCTHEETFGTYRIKLGEIYTVRRNWNDFLMSIDECDSGEIDIYKYGLFFCKYFTKLEKTCNKPKTEIEYYAWLAGDRK